MASLGYTCFHCKSPIENGYRCFRCICEKCGNNCSNRFCTTCNLFISPNSLNDSPNSSNYPSQPEIRAINDKPSRIDPNLSRFTVRSLSSKRTELRAVTEKNDLPTLHVYQEQKPETITEVVEIPSSQSTSLVPPPEFVPCVGCGESLFGFPCRWCTCEQCGNDIRDGSCLFCGSRNSFAYDPNQNSLNDSSNFSNYPSHSYEQEPYHSDFNNASYQNTPSFSCEYCGGPHYSSDCQSGNTLVYEQFPDNNFDHNLHESQSHQFHWCDYCGNSHFGSECLIRNTPVYECVPDDNSDEDAEDALLINLLVLVKDLEGSKHSHNNPNQKSMEELLAEERAAKLDSQIAFENSIRESIAKEKAARHSSQFRFIPDDSDDEDIFDDDSSSSSDETQSVETQGEESIIESLVDEHMEIQKSIDVSPSQLPESAVITPEVPTHSLSMGDEHLDTVPEKESDEFIKSSVEDLVPIPRESQGILDHMCDIPHPLVFPNDDVEMFSDCNDDDSLSCGDISYVEELPSELVSLEDENDDETDIEIKDEALRATLLNVSHLISKIEAFKEKPISSPIPIKDSDIFSDDPIPEFEAFTFDPMGERISGSTTTHSHNSLPDYESFTFDEFSCELTHIDLEYDSFTFDELSCELTHIISPPEYDHFYFDLDTPRICLDHMSLNDEIHDDESMNPPPNDDELVKMFIMTFFLFFTYRVTSPVLHSFGNEDITFDPGITVYSLYYLEPGTYLIGVELSRASNVCPNILNESPMEIVSSTSCFPKDK
jgi:hypothetical protein